MFRRFDGTRSCRPLAILLLPCLLAPFACRGPRSPQDPGADASPPPATAGHLPGSQDLTPDSPVDPSLQAALAAADRETREALGIDEDLRAFGVLDVTDGRLAWLRPDAMFYGASVPKICILHAYFEKHPEAARHLDPAVERELQLMIKRSSNELAAKYSQFVGLELVRSVQRSSRYRFYEDERGGLWSGKHYTIPEPRTADPVGGFSHAATVRQCLRFYRLLDAGELVSPEASARMREIFAAPRLEFHRSGFVRGLTGREGVTMVRKSGLWEDWHLDTARVERRSRVYLLAGMVRHERGDEWLAEMAAAIDTCLCGPPAPKRDRHEVIHHDGREGRPTPAAGESGEIRPPIPFNEALLSWNLTPPPGGGYRVELRVGRVSDDSWSPWLEVGRQAGTGGEAPPQPEGAASFEGGRIDVDYFVSDLRYDRIAYRIGATGGGEEGALRVDRVTVCVSDRTGLPDCERQDERDLPSIRRDAWQRRLPVPFRSQKVEAPELRPRICSPTSVAMVLAYRGVEAPTAEVAAAIYDPDHEIYGNWPRAVQTAWTYGVPGFLRRFSGWYDVRRSIADGQPLIISIRAAEGELTGAPYPKTAGHLMVLTGFDEAGDVRVNDPAAPDEARGRVVYRRDEIETVWLRHGGTAYVLLPRQDEQDVGKASGGRRAQSTRDRNE